MRNVWVHLSFMICGKNYVLTSKLAPRKMMFALGANYIKKRVKDARSEEEKIEATGAYLLHIEEARREREVYKMCVDASKEELLGYVRQDGEIQHQSSNVLKMHYTFDFAQSLILPHHARQIEQLYFTTPRKIHLFGVRLDGLSMQLNYMIDEDETIGRSFLYIV